MNERAIFRLQDMKTSIDNIRKLLDGQSFESMYGDAATRAAFERFLEILSEASRHVPGEWKEASAAGLVEADSRPRQPRQARLSQAGRQGALEHL